jgi:HlyD family secretion protein
MIKNCWGRQASVLLLLAGCKVASALPQGYQGTVEYEDRVLAFEVPGRIAGVPVHRGDLVKPGQALAILDDSLERLNVEALRHQEAAARDELALLEAGTRAQDIDAAEADVRAAQASEAYLRESAARAEKLSKSGAMDQSDADRASSDLERATAQRKSLEARLSALRKGARPQELARAHAQADQATAELALEEQRLARYTLRAVEAGEILDVHVKDGELAAVGTPAITMADTTHPYSDVFVPEGELTGVRVGAKANVRVDASPTTFTALVEHLSPETEFTPKFLFSQRERPHLVIRVRVRLDDPTRQLHAGVPAFAVFAP